MLVAARAPAEPVSLQLEDAVHLALTRNERSRIADLDVTVSDAGVQRARTAFFPLLTASGNDVLHPQRPTRAGVAQPSNVGTATLTLAQPLFNPSAFPLYAQAVDQLQSTRAQTVDDKRGLAFDAARAFFSILSASAVLEAAQRRLESAKANLEDTQARVRAGLVSSNDLTRAQIDLASAGREVEIDKGNVEDSYIQLEFLVNAPVVRHAVMPETTLRAAQLPVTVSSNLVRFALLHRPDLKAKRFSADAAHDFAREPMYRLAPTIGISGQVQATTSPGTSGEWHDESVQATATWALFDAGVRYADKRSRDASAEIADLSAKTLARNVAIQVRSAIVALASTQAAVRIAEKTVSASRQSAEETAILYRQGLAKAIELVDANDQRFQAEVEYAAAEYAMAEAYLSLRQALGLQPLGGELQ